MLDDFWIISRVKEEAEYVIENSAIIKQTAKKFGVAESTVHRDLNERLIQINNAMYAKVRKVLNQNTLEKSARGGQACKEKYKEQSKKQ